MMTCLNNGAGAAPDGPARVLTSAGSSSVSSGGGEANGGVGGSLGEGGGSPRGLKERLLLAATGVGASRKITAPNNPSAAVACLSQKGSTAPVPGVLVPRGSNDSIDGASSTSSASSTSTSTINDSSSSGVLTGTGPSTDGTVAPEKNVSNRATLTGGLEARVARNGGSQPKQPTATLQPEPNRWKQSSICHQMSALAANEASPVRQAPTPPPPTQPHPVAPRPISIVPAAHPPVGAESPGGKTEARPKAKAVGGDGGRPENGVEESTSLPTAPNTQKTPPPPPNATLPNPVATGITPPPPAPSCRTQAAPRPEADIVNRLMLLPPAAATEAAGPASPSPPSRNTNTLAGVAARPSTSTSSSSDPAPISTPPATGAEVAAGGPQAASHTRDQHAVPPPPRAAPEATPPLPPIHAPAAATETTAPTASTPAVSTPAASSTAKSRAAPATKRPRKEKCGDESDRASSSDMEVDSDTSSIRGAAGLATDQGDGGDTGEHAAKAKGMVGSRRAGGEVEETGESRMGGAEGAPSPPPGRSSKRARVVVGAIPGEEIRPVAAPVQEPFLEVPEVSEADVGKMVISETSGGTLTGVVESFAETEDGLGVWTIRYENGNLREVEDCGELHDDMCGYFEFAGNAAGAEAKQVRTRKSLSLQEEVRSALFGDVRSAIGKRVSVIRDKVLCEGQITKYVQPTRDGEFEQWRVTYADGTHEDMDSFELVRPLLRHIERRIEQREVEWGHRTVLVYMHRVGDSSRPFTTLSGISASMPTAGKNEEQDD